MNTLEKTLKITAAARIEEGTPVYIFEEIRSLLKREREENLAKFEKLSDLIRAIEYETDPIEKRAKIEDACDLSYDLFGDCEILTSLLDPEDVESFVLLRFEESGGDPNLFESVHETLTALRTSLKGSQIARLDLEPLKRVAIARTCEACPEFKLHAVYDLLESVEKNRAVVYENAHKLIKVL